MLNLSWALILRFEVQRADPTRQAAFLRQRRRKVNLQEKTNEALNGLLEWVNSVVGGRSDGRAAWAR